MFTHLGKKSHIISVVTCIIDDMPVKRGATLLHIRISIITHIKPTVQSINKAHKSIENMYKIVTYYNAYRK